VQLFVTLYKASFAIQLPIASVHEINLNTPLKQ